MSAQEDAQRQMAAAHAMQSGVALEMNWNPAPTDPKHLRVGVNTALCDHAGLVRLLIEKGIITEAEYMKAIADEMEREVGRFEQRAKAHFGHPNVKFH